MPNAHLEVPGAPPPHSRLMVAPPRLNLRRAASYNLLEKGPLSATSSSYNFNHLFFSPPPSPSLPALVPRPRKSPTTPRRPSRLLRRIAWIVGLLTLTYIAIHTWRSRNHVVSPKEYRPQEDAEMVGQDEVPDFPTPVMVTTTSGDPRWTVSIPEDYQFPLSIADYSDVFEQCGAISALAQKARPLPLAPHQFPMGSAVDPHYVDVQEAQSSGLLPGHRVVGQGNQAAVWRAGDLVGLAENTMAKPVCKQTMTFVLESTDAGLGKVLFQLWTAYGIAKQQGRDFFIDDSRWAYDKYAALFQPPPLPPCRPPSRQEIVPCPAQARHLVVTPATVLGLYPQLYGEQLPSESVADYKTRSRQLFSLARTGYEALFRISDGDAEYVRSRTREIAEKALKSRKVVVGLHVRHGDRHPVEEQYTGSYIPGHVFTEKAHEIVATKSPKDSDSSRRLVMVVASDDPVVYEAGGFSDALRAQERIRLASKSAIQKANPDRHRMHKFVDETFGWEGGFFAAMFWNLGVPLSSLPTPHASLSGQTVESIPSSPTTLRLRSLVGRSYAMDLAVLAGASDVVVCTASATGCRLLAVMMGWDRAIEGGNWVNIDGELGWRGM